MHELVFFYPEGHEAHYEPGHPERPERVEAIRRALEGAGWWEKYPHMQPIPLSEHVLHAVHTPVYTQMLKTVSSRGDRLDADTYTTPASWQLALNAAGGSLATSEAVWQGQARRAFTLARPPGHHATRVVGMGFCLLNNIALAAEYLVQVHGAKRLAIVDLDLHHGNGTQNIFYKRADVLYISTHQSPLYPGTGRLEETGEGPGEGTNANFPLPPNSGDEAFTAVMNLLITPLLDRFAPEALLLSVGFDPHWRDPLGHLALTAAGYGELIAQLTRWADDHCKGRIALFTEGGYDLEAGGACAQASVAALLGQEWQDPIGPPPRPEGKSWQPVVRRAQEIWGL